ncbi:hypothetical protein LTR17_004830 [Elasticomyces elasticus]|nr:hypothetical protein LTR17_004830 [Elasticomyces elasticus]
MQVLSKQQSRTHTQTTASQAPSGYVNQPTAQSANLSAVVLPVNVTLPLSSSSTMNIPWSTLPPSSSAISILDSMVAPIAAHAPSISQTSCSSPPQSTPFSTRIWDTQPLQSRKLSVASVAGIVSSILLLLAALTLGVVFVWQRRKQNCDADVDSAGSGRRPNSAQRIAGALNSSMLFMRGGPMSMVAKTYDGPVHGNNGNTTAQHTTPRGTTAAGGRPSPLGSSNSTHDNDSNSQYNRSVAYDQRLNFAALLAIAKANGSQASMQDHQDYSRPLAAPRLHARGSLESGIIV